MTFPRQVPHIPRLSELHELREDVVYAHADGVPLRFDHYRPRKVDGPAAAVIFVHGGAWMHGDPSQAAGNALHFARRGIATISLSYRLAPADRFPAPLDDVRHGLRWVRAHAAELGIDPDRLALLGLSAGAHLAMLAHVARGVGAPAGRPSSSSWTARRTRSRWNGGARRTGGRTRRWTPSSRAGCSRAPDGS